MFSRKPEGAVPTGRRPLGDPTDSLKAPVCTICHERSGYKIGMPFEEQTPFICTTCRRIAYVMDRLQSLLERLCP